MEFDTKDLFKVFVNGSLNNIPVLGQYLNEFNNTKNLKDINKTLQENYTTLVDLIKKYNPPEVNKNSDELQARIDVMTGKGIKDSYNAVPISYAELVKYTNFKNEVDRLFFGNTADEFSSLDTFIHCWFANNYSGFSVLNNEEKIMFLNYLMGTMCECKTHTSYEKHMVYKLKSETKELTKKLLIVVHNKLSTIDLDYLDEDLLAVFQYLNAELLFSIDKHHLACTAYIEAAYLITRRNTHEINLPNSHNSGSGYRVISLDRVIHNLAISFQSSKDNKELAIKAYYTAYELGSSVICLYRAAKLYSALNKVDKAIESYRYFLEQFEYKYSDYLDVRRKHASYYIFSNTQDLTDENICLCGSGQIFTNCCKDILNPQQSNSIKNGDSKLRNTKQSQHVNFLKYSAQANPKFKNKT